MSAQCCAQDVDLQLIAAAEEAISPAALLRLGGERGPQYLFNAPEGFSRLVLEHHTRPGARLRAVFGLQPSALAGFPGLVMRLKQDGHEKLHVVGPPGTLAAVTSLQHFISWQHPKVLACDTDPAICKEAYRDDHIAVLSLAGSPMSWPAPAWLTRHSDLVLKSAAAPEDFGTLKDSKTEISRTDGSSSSSSEGSTEGESSDSATQSQETNRLGSPDPGGVFGTLDRAFMQQPGTLGRQQILTLLQRSPAQQQEHRALNREDTPVPSMTHPRASQAAQAEQPLTMGATFVQDSSCRNAVLRRPSAMSSTQGVRRTDPTFWGQAVWLREHDELVLIVDCHSVHALSRIRSHPVFEHLAAQPDRLAAVLHFTPAHVQSSTQYLRWLNKLPGQQVLVGASGRELGLTASARTLARLHAVAPAIFPLPPVLQRPEGRSCEDCRVKRARLLTRLRFRGKCVELDDTDCPPAVQPSELQAALLQERSELADKVAALQRTALWKPVPSPEPPTAALPAVPPLLPAEPGRAAGPMGCSSPQPAPCSRGVHQPQHRPSLAALRGHYPPPELPSIAPVVAQLPGQQQGAGRTHSAGLAIGQFAQVLQFGRPIGLVQLTPQGWAGAPDLMHRLAQPSPAAIHQPIGGICGAAVDLAGANETPHSWTAHKRQAAEELRARKRQALGTGPQVQDPNERQAQWRAEDIELPDDLEPKAEETQANGAGREEAVQGQQTGGCTGKDASSRTADIPAYLQAMMDACDSTQLTFLGTGCAEPSKYRGSSAIHLCLKNGRGLLLDAGEGAFGQMVRCYGASEARKQVARLTAVFISHKHADHMLGLPGILRARPSRSAPLLVIGPWAAQKWLSSMAGEAQLRCHVLPCSSCASQKAGPQMHWLCEALGLSSVALIPVHHCSDAWALVVRHTDGWSICFSGDTRPCQRLVEAARSCTLLIHEATFEPARMEQAVQKRHSTTSEALEVASRANAYRVILTHFSQRYPKLPPGIEGPAAARAAVAFDGMRVPLVTLPDLPMLLPVLLCALEDGEQEREHADAAAPVGDEGLQGQQSDNSSDERISGGVEGPPVLPQHIRFDD